MTKVLIRTEGHVKLGMGNIYRSIRIAKKLEELYNAEVKFITEPISILGIKKILDAGFNVELVNFSKINHYIRYIKKFKPGIVINDVLNLEDDYMMGLKKLGVFSVNFEDKEISTTRKYADLVFNSLYKSDENLDKYYYGPKYAPLNDSFKNIKQKKINKVCKSFLLAFGGSDPSNFTIKVAKILNKIPNINVTIFLGPSFSSHEQLYDLLKYLDKEKFTIKYDVEYNPKDFENIDIAIASGGNTCYELAATGIPTILLCQNQLETDRAKIISKYGTVINLGNGNGLDENKIFKTVNELMNNFKMRERMSKNGQRLVDGNGTDRIVKTIFNKLGGA